MKTKTRNSIPIKVTKSLLAKSSNKCYFPGCDHPIIDDNHLLIAQQCHIEAYSLNGPRFNHNLSPTKINAFENLIFLCYRHHKVIDSDTVKYTVEKLKNIKAKHEEKSNSTVFKFDFDRLMQVNKEFQNYWVNIQLLNNESHLTDFMKIEVDTSQDFHSIMELVKYNLKHLESLGNILYESDHHIFEEIVSFARIHNEKLEESCLKSFDFKNRNWETYCLGFPNILNRIDILLLQTELKYFEEYLKTNTETEYHTKRLVRLKSDLKEKAAKAIIID